MLKFFRINDPYRLVSLFVLLMLLRLPVFISEIGLSLQELNWMLVGEKMSEGAILYKGVKENIAPLSAFVYWLIDEVVGRSYFTYQFLGALLLFGQAAIFNAMLLSNKAYNENSYVPALIYVVLGLTFYNLSTLSPQLMATTFYLLALNNVYQRIGQKVDDYTILRTGLFLGIAIHFHIGGVLFVLATLASLLIFTGTILRRYLLLLYGLALPFAFSAAYFYWHDALNDYSINFLYAPLIDFQENYYLSVPTLLYIGVVPSVFFVLAVLKVVQTNRFVNYQQRIQQTMVFVFIVCVLMAIVDTEKGSAVLVAFIVPMAFFITHYLLLIKKRWKQELTFALFFFSLLYLSYDSFFQWGFTQDLIKTETSTIQTSPYERWVKGKRIAVWGEELSAYHEAQLAGPFLNWNISRLQLESPAYYDNLSTIYAGYYRDLPEVIIDEQNIMPALSPYIPLLKDHYVRQGNSAVYLYKR